VDSMFNTVVGQRIALFGFAFKADPGDTRESPAIYVARQLLDEQAEVVITDPQALASARKDLAGAPGKVSFVGDPYAAAAGAHALAVLTEWEVYRQLDYRRIYAAMAKPAFLFDGRNILDHAALHRLGFSVYPIGKPALVHA
jgi:UDPglucose 6-dehydrogenase